MTDRPARRPTSRRVLRRRRAVIRGLVFSTVVAVLVVTGGVVVHAVMNAGHASVNAASAQAGPVIPPAPPAVPAPVSTAVPAALSLCDMPAVGEALGRGDDAAVIAAAGGAVAFRDAVAGGRAPCIDLRDPHHLWVVVDKHRPLVPKDYAPSPLVRVTGMPVVTNSGQLLKAPASALTALVAAADKAGAGRIGLQNGYRSYAVQVRTYGQQVRQRGTAKADEVSARPGYSEHQTGLTGDVVPCPNGVCGSLDALAGSSQGRWIAANAWRYGWIVRYEKGHTDVTGYLAEPWHLRYIGPDLARAYHDGGYHTLEEFFGVSGASDY